MTLPKMCVAMLDTPPPSPLAGSTAWARQQRAAHLCRVRGYLHRDALCLGLGGGRGPPGCGRPDGGSGGPGRGHDGLVLASRLITISDNYSGDEVQERKKRCGDARSVRKCWRKAPPGSAGPPASAAVKEAGAAAAAALASYLGLLKV